MGPVESVGILGNGDSLTSKRTLMLRPGEHVRDAVVWNVELLQSTYARRLMRSR